VNGDEARVLRMVGVDRGPGGVACMVARSLGLQIQAFGVGPFLGRHGALVQHVYPRKAGDQHVPRS
jgi:hypothetical protein